MLLFGSHGVWQGEERLGPAARRAVRHAEDAAAARGLRRATPDLLLLALLDDPEGVCRRALAESGVDLEPLRRDIGGSIPSPGAPPGTASPLDDAAREAVILGVNEARRAGLDQAGAGHILLGIVEARTGAGPRLISRQGARLAPLRKLVNDLEAAADDGGAALFSSALESALARIGGGVSCPRCAAPLHVSFSYCYRCGLRMAPRAAADDSG